MIIEVPDHAPCKTCGKTASFDTVVANKKGEVLATYMCESCGEYSIHEVED